MTIIDSPAIDMEDGKEINVYVDCYGVQYYAKAIWGLRVPLKLDQYHDSNGVKW